eukprot:1537147-Amphidinium_carterae.1
MMWPNHTDCMLPSRPQPLVKPPVLCRWLDNEFPKRPHEALCMYPSSGPPKPLKRETAYFNKWSLVPYKWVVLKG